MAVALRVLAIVLLFGTARLVYALDREEEEEDKPKYRPGLVAEFVQGGTKIPRIDEDIQFAWRGKPDSRIADGPFDVRWSGILLVTPPGEYRFELWLQGRASVRVDGKLVVEGESAKGPLVLSGNPVELEFGYRTIEVDFHSSSPLSMVKVYWSSDSFEREPVPASRLMHVPNPSAELPSRGEDLTHAYRCSSCHGLGLERVRAPSLGRLNGAVSPSWLAEYLKSNESGLKRHVPDFDLSEEDAKAVAEHLLSQNEAVKLPAARKGKSEEGRKLVERVGCLACHRIGEVGESGPLSGGDLSDIASKRPAGFFEAWLNDPKSLNSNHRMPVFELSREEAVAISSYLQSLGAWRESAAARTEKVVADHGMELAERLGCKQCHGTSPRELMADPVEIVDRAGGCLGPPDFKRGRPGYRLAEDEAKAIQSYISGVTGRTAPSPDRSKRHLFATLQCLNCHARGTRDGLRNIVAKLGITDPKQQAAMVPPSLESVGAKLPHAWLSKAVAGEAARQRPWLAPRMPKFLLGPMEVKSIVDSLEIHDMVPEDVRPKPSTTKEQMTLAARRLVGSSGFGCMSCHAVGAIEPLNVEPGARGPNLRHIDERIGFEWFRRWTRNPSRIWPGVEMPAINLGSPGVLDGNVETQLQAVWEGLNAESFDVPAQNAVQSLTAIGRKSPIVFRDLFEHSPQDHTTRPLAVGFGNGHNILLDLDRFGPRRWWFGDFANEYTRGKTWYWQTAGVTLWDDAKSPPMVALVREGKMERPVPDGPAVGWIRGWERKGDGIEVRYGLHFAGDVWVDVNITFSPLANGVRMTVVAGNVPAGAQAVWLSPSRPILATSLGAARIVATVTDRVAVDPVEHVSAIALSGKLDVDFRLDESVEAVSTIKSISPAEPERKLLPVLPGYEVVRLAMPEEVMPIGIAFRGDGSLIASSLKGGVFLARDRNKDGDLDSYTPFADDLAAPFGVLVEGEDVLVAHKHELLRLHDDDKDDYCERADVVATGWGVTFDYHDWAVGPVADGAGNYLLALSCQQDKRKPAEAIGRGQLIRTRPDGRFDSVCRGLRFPMGLARNAEGEVFATDNQGVTNTFNELNHLRSGGHYGFYNQLEEKQPEQKEEEAAIQIPHPWTGSVNGIAFVPAGDRFGPFSGHLIGAEYTTRRLIRMSLQRVGDTYQGCVYPFGEADKKAIEQDRTFLGPMALAFAPDGSLYVGSIIDSGWGGGNNRGAIERVRFAGKIPFGIREVRACSRGFDIEFTGPTDVKRASDPKAYTISNYRRIHTAGYATPDRDRSPAKVVQAEVSKDGRSVRVTLDAMRPGFVYEIAIGRIGGEENVYPAIAFYTLHAVP